MPPRPPSMSPPPAKLVAKVVSKLYSSAKHLLDTHAAGDDLSPVSHEALTQAVKEYEAIGYEDALGAFDVSVQPNWCKELTLQQQSVLLLGARGPDAIEKHHACKTIHVAYRGTVLLAAKYGRSLKWGEKADTFMSLDVFANDFAWASAVNAFFAAWDVLPAHYVKHFMHGAQILGYKHPDPRFRERWMNFYCRVIEELHVAPENEQAMDARLGDWQREHWYTGSK